MPVGSQGQSNLSPFFAFSNILLIILSGSALLRFILVSLSNSCNSLLAFFCRYLANAVLKAVLLSANHPVNHAIAENTHIIHGLSNQRALPIAYPVAPNPPALPPIVNHFIHHSFAVVLNKSFSIILEICISLLRSFIFIPYLLPSFSSVFCRSHREFSRSIMPFSGFQSLLNIFIHSSTICLSLCKLFGERVCLFVVHSSAISISSFLVDLPISILSIFLLINVKISCTHEDCNRRFGSLLATA